MNPCSTLILDFHGPGLCEDEFLLFKSPGLWCLVMALQADENMVAHNTWGGGDGDLLWEATLPLLLLLPSRAASGDSDIQPLAGAPYMWTRCADASGDWTGPGCMSCRQAADPQGVRGSLELQAGPGLTRFLLGDLVAPGQGSCSRTQSYHQERSSLAWKGCHLTGIHR